MVMNDFKYHAGIEMATRIINGYRAAGQRFTLNASQVAGGTPKQLMGIDVTVDECVPPGEVWIISECQCAVVAPADALGHIISQHIQIIRGFAR